MGPDSGFADLPFISKSRGCHPWVRSLCCGQQLHERLHGALGAGALRLGAGCSAVVGHFVRLNLQEEIFMSRKLSIF